MAEFLQNIGGGAARDLPGDHDIVILDGITGRGTELRRLSLESDRAGQGQRTEIGNDTRRRDGGQGERAADGHVAKAGQSTLRNNHRLVRGLRAERLRDAGRAEAAEREIAGDRGAGIKSESAEACVRRTNQDGAASGVGVAADVDRTRSCSRGVGARKHDRTLTDREVADERVATVGQDQRPVTHLYH